MNTNKMPINLKMKLVKNILDLKSIEQKPIRDGYGLGLVQIEGEDSHDGGFLHNFMVK